MEIMQVIVTGQHHVELQPRVLDAQLAPDELLIATECSFISAGTELSIYTGKEPQVFQSGSWCAYPWPSGYANVGIVRAVGERVTRAQVGQRVFTTAQHASVVKVNQQSLVVSVPERLDPALAAASRMAGVATTAIVVAELGQNPWVVVFGMGMVGNLAAQSFRILGGRVIGVDPTAHRRELGKACGIPHVIGGTTEEVAAAIREITGGNMADITIDAVGHSAVVQDALAITADYGQLILLGTPRAPVEGNLTALLSAIHLRWITLRGALEWCLPTYPPTGNYGGPTRCQTSLQGKQEMIFDWMLRDEMRLAPLVSHRMRPEQIKDAYDGLLHKPEIFTGVVLDWRQ